jgi:hypothetical protein
MERPPGDVARSEAFSGMEQPRAIAAATTSKEGADCETKADDFSDCAGA